MKSSNYLLKLFLPTAMSLFVVGFAFGDEVDSLKSLVYQAGQYLDTAYHLAQKIDYPLGEAKSLYMRARNLAVNNYYNEALEYLPEAINIYETLPDHKKRVAKCHALYGWLYQKLGKFHNALMHHTKAYEIYDTLGNDKGKAMALINIGAMHDSLGDLESAGNHYEEAIEVYTKVNSGNGLMYCYNNLGYIHQQRKEYEEALIDYAKSLELAKEIKVVTMESTALHNMGLTYMEMGDLDKALECLAVVHEIN